MNNIKPQFVNVYIIIVYNHVFHKKLRYIKILLYMHGSKNTIHLTL